MAACLAVAAGLNRGLMGGGAKQRANEKPAMEQRVK
jgi:hypothetical protein